MSLDTKTADAPPTRRVVAALHDCRPLWLASGTHATCSDHWWQPVGVTAARGSRAPGAR